MQKIDLINVPGDIQVIPIQINIRKTKWLILPIYRSPTLDQKHFIENIRKMIDRYSSSIDNILIIGDLTLRLQKNQLLEIHQLYSLLNKPSCFKSKTGRAIDLILANKKHSFMQSHSFETGCKIAHQNYNLS